MYAIQFSIHQVFLHIGFYQIGIRAKQRKRKRKLQGEEKKVAVDFVFLLKSTKQRRAKLRDGE
jgi:hypothetical protein